MLSSFTHCSILLYLAEQWFGWLANVLDFSNT